ncbi:D-alanine--D-alanine ligase [Shewanella sp. 202IG2-18]|uniref:D-alanine--D-alanine ligase n=1 Tax=Parashewanella hymeniacidonis TaxID=2807618 RepID=UPI0019619579|nr:D-alanine--D-alanine ligase [Parashewanella hymeniacidonis]MBM7072878.1 D-alanine--D-alanine ligase [Parashewanella hymeniacidonis]
MSQYNVILLCGGGSDEHEISLISADYIKAQLERFSQVNLIKINLNSGGQFTNNNGQHVLLKDKQLVNADQCSLITHIDFVIPCFHGFPGETGDIQSFLRLNNLPFLGTDAEASIHCFNKATAKQWFTALGIPNTPYLFLTELSTESVRQVEEAVDNWGSVFIKATNQGSSVGCYKVDSKEEIKEKLQLAFGFSSYVLVEKTMNARELEVAAYEYGGETVITPPGEIICDKNTFYDFAEKYSEESKASTDVIAKNLDCETLSKIAEYSAKAFKGMKLRHLSRIDFFLTDNNQILLNEINTFPGMTPISMFPQMLINNGHDFGEFLMKIIEEQAK